jgi:hypothetical protein
MSSSGPCGVIIFRLICLLGASVLFAQTAPQPVTAGRDTARDIGRDNDELKELFRQDQRDRGDEPFDKAALKSLQDVPWAEVKTRDTQRLKRVRAMLEAGQVQTAQDHVYAAFILQHGQSPDDYALAHVLATTAAFKSQPAPQWARWLAAAALDRFLHQSNRAQIFGTQVKGEKSTEGVMQWTFEPYDRTAVTDAMRKEWCVISLEEQERNLRRASEGKPLGPSNIRDCR